MKYEMDQVELPEQLIKDGITFDSIFEFALDVNVINMDALGAWCT